MRISPSSVFHAPRTETTRSDRFAFLVDPEGPNWLATNASGSSILERFDGKRSFGEIVNQYAVDAGYEFAKAWQHVETVTLDALRQKYLQSEITSQELYSGRAPYLEEEPLREVWLHTNNSCNLTCRHCLVSSGPDGDPGLPTAKLLELIQETRTLGAKRYFFTGGEPFIRKDIFELIDAVLADPEAELAILTNGLLFRDSYIEALQALDTSRLRLQISLDGSRPEINDPIRGRGSFERIVDGIRTAVAAGLPATVTTAIAEANATDVPRVTRLVASLGVNNHHLLWLHKRGRADAEGEDKTPTVALVIDVVREAARVAGEVGIVVDNCESIKSRLLSSTHSKRDLAAACISSLCIYSDGNVYPSASMANVKELCLGSVHEQSLEQIWQKSDVAQEFRRATVATKELCKDCSLKFLCGGGDIEHSYFYAGSIHDHDPYCELHKAMFADAMTDIAQSRSLYVANGRSGYNAPVLLASMGEGAVHCATTEAPRDVQTTRSECVLSFDLDAPRKVVQEFYGDAADEPQAELCCPVRPAEEDLTHIPKEVVERFYGCGSPVADADIQPGETTLDLGSGGGIDVFIAARRVGPEGRAIGVDMTDRMLAVAHQYQPKVAANLGYDVVEFRKGFLEEVPLGDKEVDVITSNCVINLSPDKKRVLAEMWRVLKDHGRVCFSDIISEEEVPAHQRQDPRLWGECISGALTEGELLSYLERAGFYGVQVLKKSFWKEVEGYRFFSVTVRGFKFEKTKGCVFIGQDAIYQGPFKGVSDEEGHWFPRNQPVEICTDTAAKLSKAPYTGMFVVTDPTKDIQDAFQCCSPGEGSESCC